MIVTGLDNKNISVVMDIMHAKFIVAMLRFLTDQTSGLMLAASQVVNEQGSFSTLASDAEAARSSMVSVLGPFLDNCVHKSHPAPTDQNLASATAGEGELAQPETVN